MKMKKKLVAVILSLALAVTPITGVEAKTSDTSVSDSVQYMDCLQEAVESAVGQNNNTTENIAEVCAATETPVATETPAVTTSPEVTASPEVSSATMTIYNEDGKAVSTTTPYCYTKVSQIADPDYNTYTVKAELNYGQDVIIPVKVKSAGALVYALGAEYTDVSLSSYFLYSDKTCKTSVTTSDHTAYVTKAGTYYIKVSKIYLSKIQDSYIRVVLGFVSSSAVQLKNKSSLVGALQGSSTPYYYKISVTKATKVTVAVTSEHGVYMTLCNGKKVAITDKKYVTSSGGNVVYVVAKGTYYLRAVGSKGLITATASFKTVTNASGTSKSKAGTLKVNGATKNVLVYPGASTKTVNYMKFYNSKSQKIYLNVTSSFTSGSVVLEFVDSKGKSYGKSTIYSGIDRENVYTPYVISTASSSKKLPKGTYYIKITKTQKKTSGIVQINVKNKAS